MTLLSASCNWLVAPWVYFGPQADAPLLSQSPSFQAQLSGEGFRLISNGNKSGPMPRPNSSGSDYDLAECSWLYQIAQIHPLRSVVVYHFADSNRASKTAWIFSSGTCCEETRNCDRGAEGQPSTRGTAELTYAAMWGYARNPHQQA